MVPTTDVQDLFDEPTGGLPFIAVDTVAPGETQLFVRASFESIVETTDGISEPGSSLDIFAVSFNAGVPNRVEVVGVAAYAGDATLGVREAEFRWAINQQRGKNRLRVQVWGADGFSLMQRAVAPDTLGTRVKNDPFDVAFRVLADGPGGDDPSFFAGSQSDQIPAERGSALFDRQGFESSGLGSILELPQGDVQILNVTTGVIRLVGDGDEGSNK